MNDERFTAHCPTIRDDQIVVVITYQNQVARLSCKSMDEARLVRQSFVNWNGMGQDIIIEKMSK